MGGPLNKCDTAVILAAYNAAATLQRAVRSALAQPHTREICIVDDASQDGTAALAEDLARDHARVKVIRFTANTGPSAARNAAIAATTAPWIAILDADDFMDSGRLERMHQVSADADFVADELIRVVDGDAPAAPGWRPTGQDVGFAAFVRGNLGRVGAPLDLGFVKPLIRRPFLERHTLRYREDMRLGEDYELYARALALGARFRLTPPAGYFSVERAGSLSKDHSEHDLRLLRDCDAGIAATCPLTPDEARALAEHTASVDCRLQWRRLILAVKSRDPGMALSTITSPRTAAFLAARLAEQAWLRGTAFARRGGARE